MKDNVVQLPPPPKGPHATDVVGPFESEHRVTIGGYSVPYVTARPQPDGSMELMIDGRFGLPGPVPREEFDRWMPIVANAMAVAAGYSSHGENCQPLNPFKVQMMRIGDG